MEENNNAVFDKEQKIKIYSYLITFLLIFIFVIWIIIPKEDTTTSSNASKKPSEIELMTYTQEVLKKNLPNPRYSSYKEDYTFINNTGLRYKIEGNVTTNGKIDKFYMIIEFTDNKYTNYDLISLQVGNDIIYKK